MNLALKRTCILCFFILFFIVFACSLEHSLNHSNHNDNSFVSAGHLINSGYIIYKDFTFVQVPYQAYLLSFVFKLIPFNNYLLIGKLLSWLFYILSTFFIYKISKLFLNNICFSIIIAFIFSVQPAIFDITIEAGNYVSSLCTFLISNYLFIKYFLNKDASRTNNILFFSGLFASFTVGLKLYFIFLHVSLFISILLFKGPKNWNTYIKDSFVFALGSLVGIMPLIYIICVDYENFMFNNLTYHFLNISSHFKAGSITLFYKLKHFIFYKLFELDYYLLFMFLILTIIFFSYEKYIMNIKYKVTRFHAFSVLLFITSLFTSFSLSPPHRQYFTIIIFPLLLLAIIILSDLTLKNILLNIVFFIFVLKASIHFIYAPEQFRNLITGNLKVNKIYSLSHEISMILNTSNSSNEKFYVATLSPMYVLGGRNLEIYPELSTGPFVHRIAHYLSEKERKRHKTVGKYDLIKYLDEKNPDAILIGFENQPPGRLKSYTERWPEIIAFELNEQYVTSFPEKHLDDNFKAYAEKKNFKKIKLSKFNSFLYVNPIAHNGN